MNLARTGLLALAFVASPLAAAGPTPAPPPPGNAVKGKALFREFLCYACHGTRGSNGNGGPVAGATMFSYGAFLNQVRKPRRQMPAYPAKELPDQGVADIYAYLKTIPPGPNVNDIPMLNRPLKPNGSARP